MRITRAGAMFLVTSSSRYRLPIYSARLPPPVIVIIRNVFKCLAVKGVCLGMPMLECCFLQKLQNFMPEPLGTAKTA